MHQVLLRMIIIIPLLCFMIKSRVFDEMKNELKIKILKTYIITVCWYVSLNDCAMTRLTLNI